ncbi:Hsp20/alpha crystallin family protein [Natrarchaeobius oligotrophus]|uniref:Hsp20/alpha crystallin family protein n=1 Tax=Natrarchaeobius chitinivorans TaxID=1679083 RepID=A0A3N6PNY1_NATCH|nr:Hsp20/alpha crystallin family protein [Natrarchaeobius chitinivorans]RQH00826.1 hypothetical protein EA472_09325 [Natrarchaeobius chitinivorans]
MSPSTFARTGAFRTRIVHDRDGDRVAFVVDAIPATADDVRVEAGSSRVRIRIRTDAREYDRTFPSPSGQYFTDERSAVLTNGILTVTVGTAGRPRP